MRRTSAPHSAEDRPGRSGPGRRSAAARSRAAVPRSRRGGPATASGPSSTVRVDGSGGSLPGEHGVQVARDASPVPPTALPGCGRCARRCGGVVLQLAHDGLRDVRASGEIALSHAQFGQARSIARATAAQSSGTDSSLSSVRVGARNAANVTRPADTRGRARRGGRVVRSCGSRLWCDGGVVVRERPAPGCGAAGDRCSGVRIRVARLRRVVG